MGAKTIIECVAQGKLGARSIDAFLREEDMAEVAHRLELEERKPDLFDIVPYKPVEPKVKDADAALRRAQAQFPLD